MLLDEETFSTVLWFFCDHDRRQHGRNMPRDDKRRHDQVARKFVHEMIEEAWSLKAWWPLEDMTQEEVKVAMPKIVETRGRFVPPPHDLGELDFLWQERRETNDNAYDALKRLALFEDGSQKYRAAEEAVDTYAGRSLLILEAKRRETERQRRIADAERRAREAQQDLEAAQKV